MIKHTGQFCYVTKIIDGSPKALEIMAVFS